MTGNGNFVKFALKKIREITSSLAGLGPLENTVGQGGRPGGGRAGWLGLRPVGLPVIEQR